VPCRPVANAAVLDLLGTKVIRDNRPLIFAPAFLDVRIIVVWLVHDGFKHLRGGEAPFAKPPNVQASCECFS